MMIIYLIMAVSAGREYVEATFSGGQNYLVYAIIMAITFAAGVFIILQGVRLILAEIVPAFTGFSENWCQTRVRRWTARWCIPMPLTRY